MLGQQKGLGHSIGLGGLSDFIAPRRSALMGFAAGLGQGNNFGQGVGYGLQYAMQGQQQDDANAIRAKEEAARQQQMADAAALKEKYSAFFMEQNRPDIAQGIADGIVEPGAAYMDFIKPQGGDPFTLGPGQVRYGPDGKPIAQGPAQSPENIFNIGGSNKFSDTVAGEMATQQTGLVAEGRNARSNNMLLGQLSDHLKRAPQGGVGAMVQFAGNIGIPLGDGVGDAQAAEAIINKMVPAQRPPGSGPMSDRDLEMYKQSLPRLINQPGGNEIIIRTGMAINEYAIEQARIAEQVVLGKISLEEGLAQQAAVPNPLAGFSGAAAPPAAGGLPPGVKIRRLD
jgi:hypothetical protein